MSNHFTGLLLSCAVVITSAVQTNAMHGMNRMHSDTSCTTKITREYGFIIPGFSWTDIAEVNDFLSGQGISPFKMMTPTLSIGGHKEIRRLVMESDLTLRYWRDNVKSNLRTSLYTGDILWNNGVNVLPAAMPAIAFPYIGLGVGLASMHIRSEEKTFRQILASSEPSVMLWQASFLLNAGIGADALITKKGRAHGIAIGMRGGYLLDPFFKKQDRNWFSDRVKIQDVPLLKQNGPYLRLMVGGW